MILKHFIDDFILILLLFEVLMGVGGKTGVVVVLATEYLHPLFGQWVAVPSVLAKPYLIPLNEILHFP